MSIKAARDNRLDFIRGLAILLITINHTYPNESLATEQGHYQLRLGLFFNGADIFVSFSGIVCGLVYAKIISENGLYAGIVQSTNRILQIFLLHTMAFFCVAAVVLVFKSWGFVAPVHGFDDLLAATKGTLLLYDPIPFFSILNLYILFLLILPFFITAQMKSNTPILLSAVIYALNGLAVILGFSFEESNPFFVSPAAWQFMFFGGVAIGMKYQRIRALLPPLSSTIGYIILYFFITHFMREQGWIVHRLSGKYNLGILRLTDLLIVCYVIDRLVEPSVQIMAPVLKTISTIGSNSLFCFAVTLIVCYVGSGILTAINGGRLAYIAVLLVEIFLMIGIGHALQKNARFRHATQMKWLNLERRA